jgi:hypothetical protein
MGADHDCSAVVDIVERVDRPNSSRLEVGYDALVVDDLAKSVRLLAFGSR